MILNFRDSSSHLQILVIFLIPFVLLSCVAAPATDQPAPMLVRAALPSIAASKPVDLDKRVKIRSARAQFVSADNAWVRRIVHPENFEELVNPVLVSAEVNEKFSDRPRALPPVIVLNGQPLTRSIVVRGENDRLYAVARNGSKFGSKIQIQVGWFGSLPKTQSQVVEVSIE